MQPGSIANLVPAGPDDMPRRIRALERQVQQLAAARRLEAATIGAGGLTVTDEGKITVKDEASREAVTIGKLASGDYGLSVTDASGDTIPLSQLAFGTTAASVAGLGQADTNTGWHDLDGPSVDVTVHTGRLLVMVSANMFNSLGSSEPVMSWALSGPTDVVEDELRSLTFNGWGAASSAFGGGSYCFLHTGLAAGDYHVKARYNAIAPLTATDTGFWKNRSLVCLPF